MNSVEIGKFIADCRKEKGLTQQQLADQLQITNKAVSKWETGNGMPDILLLQELASILNVTVDEILDGKRHNNEVDSSKVVVPSSEENKATQSSPIEDDVTAHSSDSTHNITDYLVQKAITKYKLMGAISMVFAVVGIIVPFFIWAEGSHLAGCLFGCWLEICSAGIFFYYYSLMKTEITSYNRCAQVRLDLSDCARPYKNIGPFLWIGISALLLIIAIV